MKEKILLALSDANLSSVISEQLTKVGYMTDSTSNGKEVINKMKSFIPDLLLIDIVLSNKNGYDILSEKSFDREVTKIPVIIVSNSGEPIHMNKIPSTPAIKDYIIKSHVEPAEVLEKIDKVFGRGPITETEAVHVASTGKGRKVLWAEDDKLLGNILSKKIQESGYTLLKAKNAEETFDFLAKEIPDIIVLDIMLPGASGIEILQEIKKNEHLKKIPVVMLSNLNTQSDIEKARSLGANKFLVKATVSLEEITKEIESMIKR